MTARLDVIAIGGGPAGTAVALGLRQAGRSVLVVERSHYQEWRVGETLPPGAQVYLAELGVWERFGAQQFIPSYAIHAAWGSDELHETDFIFNPYGHGWHIDRKRFDAMLADAVTDSGGIVCWDTRISAISRADEGWRITLENSHGGAQVGARFLVDASGPAAWAATRLGAQRLLYDRMIGVAALLAPRDAPASVQPVLLLEAVEDGWWYSVPLPDRSLLATFMTDPDVLTRSGLTPAAFWSQQMQCAARTAERAGDGACAETVCVRRAATARLEPAAGAAWLAVGDAASAYDPLSATGICKALAGGLSAARAIHACLDGDGSAIVDYASGVVREFDTYLSQRNEYYGRERRWPHAPFWSRRSSGTNRPRRAGENGDSYPTRDVIGGGGIVERGTNPATSGMRMARGPATAVGLGLCEG